MVGELASVAGLAAVALVLAFCLHRWNVGKMSKFIPWLMLIAGLGVTGLIASVIDRFVSSMFDVVGGVTATVFGVGLPIILLVVMVIKFWSDVKGSGGSSKSGMVNAFLLFPVLSVPFAAFAAWATDLLGTAGSSIAEILAQL